MDSTVSPDAPVDDQMSSDTELCVPLDSIAVDGIRPSVGDMVPVKVEGPVTRIVNENAYVRVQMVNDQPIPEPPLKPNPGVDEMDRLERLSRQHDADTDY